MYVTIYMGKEFEKKMENLIWARVEDYNLGGASQKALRTVPPSTSQDTVNDTPVFESEGWTSCDILLTVLQNPDLSSIVVGHVTPYKIKKECYLLRHCIVPAGKMMLLFRVEQIFLPMGRFDFVSELHNVQRGREEAEEQRRIFCLHFSCLAIKIWFLFLRIIY